MGDLAVAIGDGDDRGGDASATSASRQSVQSMIAVTPTIVSTCWKKKMSP
jgi:hypothetical protein